MSFNWENYLDVAIHLKENANNPFLTEGMYRSSCSRAYYSAFHFAIKAAVKQGLPKSEVKKGGLHKRIIDYYIYNNDSQFTKIGSYLQTILTNREESDYNDNVQGDFQSKASMTIRLADQIIIWAKSYLASP